ncbi:baseplate assembly protein [Chromobacterium amazonense]|uniref:Baseplate J/gp47 family protein n=1 Tax=Chromobacterium amazonense TaxID=1382803 RepID=A0ABU8V2L2_9NEIS|nr:baseplate J/gp47 family protein [Chromobacterium amazonense]MDQ4540738.1 baseplate J/gp47 family protein [Chromobacterium amazonense]
MAIDLTRLPAPAIIEPLDYETLLAEYKAQLLALAPAELRDSLAAALQLESESLTLLLELAAYRELLQRQRINEAAKASLLAYATGTDLDNRAADYGVARLLIQPANPDANPPTEAVWEDDTRLRYRCQMALEGLSVAGSRGAYLFHTLSASADVADAYIDTPRGGTVRVWLLDRRGNGVADAALCATVAKALNAEDVRPLCDSVEVKSAQPKAFTIEAIIEWLPGGESLSGGLSAAQKRIDALLVERRQIAAAVPRSAIDAALHAPGVNRVTLKQPATDLLCTVGEFPSCSKVSLS